MCELSDLNGLDYMFSESSANNADTQGMLKKQQEIGAQLHYLALSGGGANGTFGAGYLVGWGASGDLPDFNYVTGVSAGALLATQAFIGDVGPLVIFDQLTANDIVRNKILPFSLFSDSLYSSAPLREVVKKLNTSATLEKVAAKFRRGGILQVGVVNLDSGELVRIDLGVLAEAYHSSGSPEIKSQVYNRYIDAILASTSIPIMMPPIYLDCAMMVDGGVRNQIFLKQSMRAISENSAYHANGSEIGGPKIHVTVLVNGVVSLDLSAFDKNSETEPNLQSIGGRSILTMIDSSLDNDIYRICQESVQNNSTVAFVSMDQIDSRELAKCRTYNDGLFDGNYMSCLYRQGEYLGRSGQAERCPADG